MRAPRSVPSAPFRWLFSWIPVVSLQKCSDQYSAEDAMKSLPHAPFSPALFSLAFCPATSSYHVFPGHPALSPPLRESVGLLLGFFILCCSLDTLKYPCSNPLPLYFVYLLSSGRRVTPVPVKPFKLDFPGVWTWSKLGK